MHNICVCVWIGSRANLNRKPWFSHVSPMNTRVSWKCSLQPIQWCMICHKYPTIFLLFHIISHKHPIESRDATDCRPLAVASAEVRHGTTVLLGESRRWLQWREDQWVSRGPQGQLQPSMAYIIWLVVWKSFYFSHILGIIIPID